MATSGIKSNQIKGGSGGGGSSLRLRAAEAITKGQALYAKVRKVLTIDSSNDQLTFNEGGSDFTVSIAQGEYLYPYTALAADIKSKMEAAGANTYVITLSEQNHKIATFENSGTFNLIASGANSILPTLGFGAIDLTDSATFYRAAGIHTFSREKMWQVVNTDNDSNPPTEDDGSFTPVSAAHRSESFSAIARNDGAALSSVTGILSGEADGLSGLTIGSDYYTNGTAGQIALSQVANSIIVGKATSDEKVVVDEIGRGYLFDCQPDTDISPNTTDGVLGWETLPEVPNFFEGNVALHGNGADGNVVVSAQVDSDTLGTMRVSYSTDKGKSWKLANLNPADSGLSVNETTINTRSTSNWNNTNEYYSCSPRVIVRGNKVFVAFSFFGSTRHLIGGFYGEIDSNGDLTLRGSNEFQSSPFDNFISDSTFSGSLTAINAVEKNGVIYVTAINDTDREIYVHKSNDMGATFETGTVPNVKNVATQVQFNIASFQDFQPHRIAVVDVPGQSVTPTELITNGTFDTDISGWTELVSSITWNNGRINLSSAAQAEQIINTTVGKSYTIKIDQYRIAGPGFGFLDVKDAANGQLGSYRFSAEVQSGQVTFIATTTTTKIQLEQTTGGGTVVEFDNITCSEVAQNRLAVAAPYFTGGEGAPFGGWWNLFYTDDQDLGNNWATSIDLPQDLSSGWHLPIGEFLGSDDKWLIHTVTSHGSGNGAGTLSRVGDTARSQITEIDLSQVTPTFERGIIRWDDAGSNDLAMTNGEGSSQNNSNGRAFFRNEPCIIKTDDGVLTYVNANNGNGYMSLTTDMSNVAANTQIIQYNDYDNNQTGGNSILSEPHFQEVASGLQFVGQRAFGSNGDNDTLGKIVASTLTVDTSAKTELVTNGTFDTDISGWTAETTGTGFANFNSGAARLGNGSSGNIEFLQELDTEPGKFYILQFRMTTVSGTYAPRFEVYNQALADIPVDSGKRLLRLQNSSEIPSGSLITYYFRAEGDKTLLLARPLNNNEVLDLDDVSVELASIQAAQEIDIIDKPNVDEQGFAGRIQTVSSDGTIHMQCEKELTVEDTADIENVVYNNFGLKQINVANTWEKFPTEANDAQSIDLEPYRIAFDPDNPLFGVMVSHDVNSGTPHKIRSTNDGGDTWQIVAEDLNTVSNFTKGSGYYLERSPAIAIRNKKVFIGLVSSGTLSYGRYGTIQDDGSLTLQESNSGSAIVSTANNTLQLRASFNENADKILFTAIDSNNNNMYYYVSNDDGATFSAQDSVEDGAGTALVGYSGVYENFVFGDRICAIVFDNDVSTPSLMYSDDDGATWETRVQLGPALPGSVFIQGIKRRGNRLAATLYTATNPNSLYITICDDMTVATPVFSTPVEITGEVGPVAQGNGEISPSTSNLRMAAQGRILWTSDTSLIAAYNQDQVRGCARASIIADTSNIAATNTTVDVFRDDTAPELFSEAQVMQGDNGKIFIISKLADTNFASNQTVGRILAKEIDTDGNVSEPAIDLAFKSSVSGFAGRIQASGQTVAFATDNGLGFESVFTNHYKERQINEEVEEWRQVPPQITNLSSDAAIWGFDRKGESIIAATQRAGSTGLAYWYSTDSGKNFVGVGTGKDTGISPNNTANYFEVNPDVRINSDETKAVIVYSENTVDDIEAYQLTKEGDSWILGANTTLVNLGVVPFDIRTAYDPVNNKLYAGGRSGSTDAYNLAVSSDFGATWSSSTSVKDGVSTAAIWSDSPIHVEAVDIGAGNTRICVFGLENTLPFALKMWYSDDDGATWETAITIQNLDNNNDALLGIKKFGNKLAVLGYGTFNTSGAYISICQDLTAATPVFSSPVDIADGVGIIDTYNGYTTVSSSIKFNKLSLNRIEWIDSDSLMVCYDRQGADFFIDTEITYIPDVTSPGTNTKFEAFDGVSSTNFEESQLVKSASGKIYVVAKKVGPSAGANNLTAGRILAREVMSDGSLGVVQDIAFKSDIATGGFAGRIQVKGDTVIFEKEDTGSTEQLYFNSIELRRVQKGE